MSSRQKPKAQYYAIIERQCDEDVFFTLLEVVPWNEAAKSIYRGKQGSARRLLLKLPKDGDLQRLAESRLAKHNAAIAVQRIKGVIP